MEISKTSESRLLQQLLKVIIMTSISFSFFLFFLWGRRASEWRWLVKKFIFWRNILCKEDEKHAAENVNFENG